MPLGMRWRRHGLERASREQSVDPKARKPRMSGHLPGLAEGAHERKSGVQPRGDELESARLLSTCWASFSSHGLQRATASACYFYGSPNITLCDGTLGAEMLENRLNRAFSRLARLPRRATRGGLLWSRPLTQRAPCSPTCLLACTSVCPSPPSASSALL